MVLDISKFLYIGMSKMVFLKLLLPMKKMVNLIVNCLLLRDQHRNQKKLLIVLKNQLIQLLNILMKLLL
ncbi:unnamed protein product [Paramecium primaurelia]|uniref:Uncharacterized protein n=1 Tax=Paramecium primaurelia TaxID=5886 RepID=A0A8S1NXW5_PARPR|nr:unnamed protein product [Paramecium primaurelia]